MEHSQEIIQFYDTFAAKYDETVLQERDYIAFEKIPAWLLAVLPDSPANICDLGCGTGLGARPFLEAGHQVTGIDISPKMVERARSLGFKQLICQSLEEPLPFEADQFEGAQLLGVMEFIQNPQALFREVARVLKPEGIFGLTVPKKLPHDVEQELGIFSFHPNDIEQILGDAGFSIVRKEDFQGFIYKGKTVFYRAYMVKKISG